MPQSRAFLSSPDIAHTVPHLPNPLPPHSRPIQRYGGGLSRVPRGKPDLPTGDNLKSPSSSASPVYYWHGSDSSAPGERSGTLTLKRASASAVRGMRKAVKSPAAPRKKAAPQPGRKSKAKTVSAPK